MNGLLFLAHHCCCRVSCLYFSLIPCTDSRSRIRSLTVTGISRPSCKARHRKRRSTAAGSTRGDEALMSIASQQAICAGDGEATVERRAAREWFGGSHGAQAREGRGTRQGRSEIPLFPLLSPLHSRCHRRSRFAGASDLCAGTARGHTPEGGTYRRRP